MLHAKRIDDEDKIAYLTALLTEEECAELFGRCKEWKDISDYESEEEIIEENLIVGIYYKGYDMMARSLCVVLEYEFLMPEYRIRVMKSIFFDSFEEYYRFLDGEIYENTSYYGYSFDTSVLERYGIDPRSLEVDVCGDKTLDNVRSVDDVMAVLDLKWNCAEKQREMILKAAKHFFEYESFEAMAQEHPETDRGHYHTAAQLLVTRYPERVLKIVEAEKPLIPQELSEFALLYYRDGATYQKYQGDNPLLPLCDRVCGIRKDTPMTDETRIGFDDKTHLFYRDHIFSFDDSDRTFYFRELFESVEDLAHAMNNDFSNADFSDCRYPIDWSAYKTENAKIQAGETVRVLNVKLRGNEFQCEVLFERGNVCISSDRFGFFCTREFIHFMKYDLCDDGMQEALEKLKNGAPISIVLN